MIHEIGVELGAQLAGRGCPFPVIDGPEIRTTTTGARERIVIEHDMQAGDTFEPRHQTDRAPRTRLTRLTGVKLTIYAQHPNKGAIYWEHKRRAEHVLDLVLVGLDYVVRERKNLWHLHSGKFVFPPDLKESETPGSATYELYFAVDRGVREMNWDFTTQATATIAPYMVGGPPVTFSASAHTITRAFGSFLVDQFAVGQTIIVSGSTSNNGTRGPISALTDSTMTFASGLTNEGPVSGVSITGNGVLVATSTQATGATPEGGSSTETVT